MRGSGTGSGEAGRRDFVSPRPGSFGLWREGLGGESSRKPGASAGVRPVGPPLPGPGGSWRGPGVAAALGAAGPCFARTAPFFIHDLTSTAG